MTQAETVSPELQAMEIIAREMRAAHKDAGQWRHVELPIEVTGDHLQMLVDHGYDVQATAAFRRRVRIHFAG